MGVELYLAVVAKSSMLANLTHTDIVLLHAHTTHTHTRTHTHTHIHTHAGQHTHKYTYTQHTHTHNTHTHTHTWPCHIASLIHLHAWGRLNFFTPAKNNIGLNNFVKATRAFLKNHTHLSWQFFKNANKNKQRCTCIKRTLKVVPLTI